MTAQLGRFRDSIRLARRGADTAPSALVRRLSPWPALERHGTGLSGTAAVTPVDTAATQTTDAADARREVAR